MLTQEKKITETEILRICEERDSSETETFSFEEAYKIWLNYTPKI